MKDQDDVEDSVERQIREADFRLKRAIILLEEIPCPPDLVRRFARLSRELSTALAEFVAEAALT